MIKISSPWALKFIKLLPSERSSRQDETAPSKSMFIHHQRRTISLPYHTQNLLSTCIFSHPAVVLCMPHCSLDLLSSSLLCLPSDHMRRLMILGPRLLLCSMHPELLKIYLEMSILKLMLEVSLMFPDEGSSPNSKNSAIIKILVESIKYRLMMNMSTIPQKVDSLLISFFRFVIFRKGELLNANNCVLKFDKPVSLQDQ